MPWKNHHVLSASKWLQHPVDSRLFLTASVSFGTLVSTAIQWRDRATHERIEALPGPRGGLHWQLESLLRIDIVHHCCRVQSVWLLRSIPFYEFLWCFEVIGAWCLVPSRIFCVQHCPGCNGSKWIEPLFRSASSYMPQESPAQTSNSCVCFMKIMPEVPPIGTVDPNSDSCFV